MKPKPVFEFFGREHVPKGENLEATYYPDGQLKEFAFLKDGKKVEWLTLRRGKPEGKRENTAEVQEYNADGTMWDYAGMYDHGPYTAKLSFADWVRAEIDGIWRASQGENVSFFRAF